MSNGKKTFVKITNRDIYDEIQEIKKIIPQVKLLWKWLIALSSAFGVCFLFIIKLVIDKLVVGT